MELRRFPRGDLNVNYVAGLDKLNQQFFTFIINCNSRWTSIVALSDTPKGE